jgi:hypothetical protein
LCDPVDYSGTDEDYGAVVSSSNVIFGLLFGVLGGLPSILQSMRQSQALSPSYAIDTPRFLGILAALLLRHSVSDRLLAHREVAVRVMTDPKNVFRARL